MDLVRLTRDEDDNLVVEATGEPTIPLKVFRPQVMTFYPSIPDLRDNSHAKAEIARRISICAVRGRKGVNAYELGTQEYNEHWVSERVFDYPLLFYQINEHQHQRAVSAGRDGGDELTIIPEYKS